MALLMRFFFFASPQTGQGFPCLLFVPQPGFEKDKCSFPGAFFSLLFAFSLPSDVLRFNLVALVYSGVMSLDENTLHLCTLAASLSLSPLFCFRELRRGRCLWTTLFHDASFGFSPYTFTSDDRKEFLPRFSSPQPTPPSLRRPFRRGPCTSAFSKTFGPGPGTPSVNLAQVRLLAVTLPFAGKFPPHLYRPLTFLTLSLSPLFFIGSRKKLAAVASPVTATLQSFPTLEGFPPFRNSAFHPRACSPSLFVV